MKRAGLRTGPFFVQSVSEQKLDKSLETIVPNNWCTRTSHIDPVTACPNGLAIGEEYDALFDDKP